VSERLEKAANEVVSAAFDYFAAVPQVISISQAGKEDLGIVIRLYGQDEPEVISARWRPGGEKVAKRSAAEPSDSKGTA
jgi:hypothetical protein